MSEHGGPILDEGARVRIGPGFRPESLRGQVGSIVYIRVDEALVELDEECAGVRPRLFVPMKDLESA